MAVLEIVKEGAPVLRKQAEPVTQVTKRIRRLVKDMLDTMYEANGVGLAAPQVGMSQRIIVVDVGEGPVVLINPEIEEAAGSEIDSEGCLSIPGRWGYVERAQEVVVTGLNDSGRSVRLRADGLFARALQHEIDHLDGVLFIDKALEIEEDEAEEEEEKEEAR
ncbi:MAG: peptide deformylase [Firmicutes bacterium]|jgi:peptide deformylase|nr:peptide deformylase [Bacillota bacterium]